MKIKFIFRIPLLLFILALVSCQSEEPNPNSFPEIGETSGNYIAFKFDGNEYVSASRSSFWGASYDDPYRGTYISDYGKRFTGLLYKYYDTITSTTFTIILQNNPKVNEVISLGKDYSGASVETPIGNSLKFTYQTNKGYLLDTLRGPDSSPLWYVTAGDSYDFRTNDIEKGELTFTLIDTVNQIYQGTFWADIKFHKYEYYGSSLYDQPTNEEYWNLVAVRTNIDTEKVIRIRDGRFYFNPKKPDLRHHKK